MGKPLFMSAIAACAALGACDSEPTGADPQTMAVDGRAPAVAGPTEDQRCGTRMDANQDGAIQQAEYYSFAFAFDNWDVDDDYSVTPAEFQRCWGVVGWGSSEAAFRAFDEDGDGSLDQEEFFSRGEFQRWDADGDGAISATERQ